MTVAYAPQDDTTFTAIRYYTQFDPYFYTVDNRPLQDVETNLKAIRSGGAEAARRAVLIDSLGMSTLYQTLFPKVTGVVRTMTGLNISIPVANSLTVSAGAVYEARAINDNVATTVVKQATLFAPQTLTFTPPVTAGNSLVYTIEAQFVDYSAANLTTSPNPYVDATNTFLPSSLLQGELRLQRVAGTAAATGTELPVATSAGWYPLYNVTYTNGVANPVISAHANSPLVKGLATTSLPVMAHTTSGATQSILQDSIVYSFADAVTSTVVVPVTLQSDTISPFKPLKLKMVFSPSITGGNYALQIRYKGQTAGDLITTARTTSGLEVVPVTVPADSVQSAVFATAIIPNTEFAGFVGGTWTIIKDRVSVVLDRLGAHASDTSTGVLRLFEVVVSQ